MNQRFFHMLIHDQILIHYLCHIRSTKNMIPIFTLINDPDIFLLIFRFMDYNLSIIFD